jgi:hypothetical protein
MRSMPSVVKKLMAAALLAGLFSPLATAKDRLDKDLEKYQQETNPVHKARALAKLAKPQIDLARKQLNAGDEVASLHTLEQFRDECQKTFAALKATGINAVKKPSGFKQLQIAIRQSIYGINDLILALPVDKRIFFRAVRTDLINVQNQLIDALFPRAPNRKEKHDP